MKRLFSILLLLLVGCDRKDLKLQEDLGDLRILAFVVDQPEAAPGATVNLTPFVSDQNGGGRALSYSAEGCIDPGLQLGAQLTCVGRPDRVTIATAAALPLAAPSYAGNAPTFAVNLPATMLDGLPPPAQENGVAYLVFYTVKAADGASTVGFKRIFASTRAVKNQNPAIDTVTIGGAAPGALPTAQTPLRLTVTPASKETYTVINSDGAAQSKTEEPLVSWFISDGEIESRLSTDNEDNLWTPPTKLPLHRPVMLVAVVRDRRGGDAVWSYTFP